jgi:murein DD-endopeptidase MepM/ murein hydrolase activator NlpD
MVVPAPNGGRVTDARPTRSAREHEDQVQRASTYAGRHRGRHRAIPEQRTRGLTLPGAAAAALTITATGAAVVPGLGGGTASATEGLARTTEPPHSQSARLPVAVASDLSDSELVAGAQRARVHASRAQMRKDLAEKREAALARAHRWVLPIAHYRFSSPFGSRWGRFHAGDDLAAPVGTRIGSLSSGTVIFAGQESGYGNKVEVRHWDGTVSWYAHMSSISVKVGEDVRPGDKLGEVGNTGHSTGPHLHLEIHPDGGPAVNPQRWLAAHGLAI